MKKYLVIGNPIEHSLSPLIHNYWIKRYHLVDSIYEKRKVEEKDLKNIIKEIKDEKIIGVNVTLPFKKLIISFLDKLHASAKDSGSVNTLHKDKNKIIGSNTDATGFLETINDYYGLLTPGPITDVSRKDFLVLGAGGVTSSVIVSLQHLVGRTGRVWVSNRSMQAASQLEKLFPKVKAIKWGDLPPVLCDMVINTTSVGLKKNDNLNIDFTNYTNKNTLFYDLIYNPKETNFLKKAKLRGNKTMNGQMMFLKQATEAFRIWTNILPEIDDEVIKLLDR